MDVGALLQHSQYAIPVGIVLVCAILVFVFGFKNAEQPPFAQLTSGSDVDRKPAGKKRNKIKEKQARAPPNGQVVAADKASPVKKAAPVKTESIKKNAVKNEEVVGNELKERKQDGNKPVVARKEKLAVPPKLGKENKVEQVKNRKNLKNSSQEKPVDFDDGDWEQPAYARKDKKNKKKDDDSPPKKSKKEGKKAELISEISRKEKEQSRSEVKDKVAKDTENKELKEKDKKDVILTPVAEVQPAVKVLENKEEEELEKIVIPEKVERIESSEKPVEKKTAKVKKAKKAVVNENDLPISKPISPEKLEELAQELVEEDRPTKSEEVIEEKRIEQVEEKSSVVFDELGDVWTEAKPQKKSKKKARKDN